MRLRRVIVPAVAVLALAGCTTASNSGGNSTPRPSHSSTVKPSTSKPTAPPKPSTAAVAPGKYIKCSTKLTSDSDKPVLRGVRSGRHDTFDRLAFDFCRPAKVKVQVVQISRNEVRTDPRGLLVKLKGTYFYKVVLTSVDAHAIGYDTTVYRGLQKGNGTSNIVEFRFLGDFEGYVTYAVGTKRLRDTRVLKPVKDPADSRHVSYPVDFGH